MSETLNIAVTYVSYSALLTLMLPLAHYLGFSRSKKMVERDFLLLFEILKKVKTKKDVVPAINYSANQSNVLTSVLKMVCESFVTIKFGDSAEIGIRTKPSQTMAFENLEKHSIFFCIKTSSKRLIFQVLLSIVFLFSLSLILSDTTNPINFYTIFAACASLSLFITTIYLGTFEKRFISFAAGYKEVCLKVDALIARHIKFNDLRAAEIVKDEVFKKNNDLLLRMATQVATLLEQNESVNH